MLAALLHVAAASAAKPAPSPSRLRRDLDRAASWTATAAYVARRRTEHAVPAHYARDALRAAVDGLSTATTEVARDAVGVADGRDLALRIDGARRLVDALVVAIDHDDAVAVAASVGPLEAAANRLGSTP